MLCSLNLNISSFQRTYFTNGMHLLFPFIPALFNTIHPIQQRHNTSLAQAHDSGGPTDRGVNKCWFEVA